MDAKFWQTRWSEGRIGFHEGKPNGHLLKHMEVFRPSKRIFVPLCGKTEDLAFLAASGHQVVGVELVESAVRAFFDEHAVQPAVAQKELFTQFTTQNITVLVGDFFACTGEILGEVDALYDRAALIALPETMRGSYVKHLRALMPANAPGLVITLEYPQDVLEGPPFSVPEAELRAHYAGSSLERIDQVKAEGPRLTQIDALEKCFVVRF